MKEKNIQSLIMLALSNIGATVFRQNSGMGWAGKATKITHAGSVPVKPGDVVVRAAYPLRAGLCEGSPDIVGWRTVQITPEMVGREVAIFCGVEVKTDTGRSTARQEAFISAVRHAGGIAGIARSSDEAIKLLEAWGNKKVDNSNENVI